MKHRHVCFGSNREIWVVCINSFQRTIQLWHAKRSDEQLICMGMLFIDVPVCGENGTVKNERKSILLGAHRDGCISLLKANGNNHLVFVLFFRYLFQNIFLSNLRKKDNYADIIL